MTYTRKYPSGRPSTARACAWSSTGLEDALEVGAGDGLVGVLANVSPRLDGAPRLHGHGLPARVLSGDAACNDEAVLQTLRSVLRFRRIETDPVARRLQRAACVDDLRRVARRRLPGGVFDYIDGAAEDERTLAANRAAFAAINWRPRVLRGVEKVDISSTLLGRPLSYPLVLAPTGFTRIADPEGELAVARAAARAGLPYTLSTLGTRSIEEVRAASDGRLWFQVYTWRDRGLVKEMVDRAAAEDYEALVLTVDTSVLGRRERDVRRGFSMPPSLGPETLLDGALHPAWTWSFVRSEPIRFANVVGREVGDGATPVNLAHYTNSQFDASLSWDDVDWLRSVWDGPILLKGVQTVEDAVLAAERGVDAVVLSNHGGRQLDGAPATLPLVAPVADAMARAGGRLPEIICDGGIRRGGDILKALAAGAAAAMAGRAYLYGLGAAGERGVDTVLEWFRSDLVRTMNLLGVGRIGEVDRSLVELPTSAG
jgi:L-lactate dehydrogenase (cytochrome)